MLTETDEVATAIDAAAPRYPGASRADVVRHLIQLGAEVVLLEQRQHGEVVRRRAGRHPGLYPAGHLDRLREDWPE